MRDTISKSSLGLEDLPEDLQIMVMQNVALINLLNVSKVNNELYRISIEQIFNRSSKQAYQLQERYLEHQLTSDKPSCLFEKISNNLLNKVLSNTHAPYSLKQAAFALQVNGNAHISRALMMTHFNDTYPTMVTFKHVTKTLHPNSIYRMITTQMPTNSLNNPWRGEKASLIYKNLFYTYLLHHEIRPKVLSTLLEDFNRCTDNQAYCYLFTLAQIYSNLPEVVQTQHLGYFTRSARVERNDHNNNPRHIYATGVIYRHLSEQNKSGVLAHIKQQCFLKRNFNPISFGVLKNIFPQLSDKEKKEISKKILDKIKEYPNQVDALSAYLEFVSQCQPAQYIQTHISAINHAIENIDLTANDVLRLLTPNIIDIATRLPQSTLTDIAKKRMLEIGQLEISSIAFSTIESIKFNIDLINDNQSLKAQFIKEMYKISIDNASEINQLYHRLSVENASRIAPYDSVRVNIPIRYPNKIDAINTTPPELLITLQTENIPTIDFATLDENTTLSLFYNFKRQYNQCNIHGRNNCFSFFQRSLTALSKSFTAYTKRSNFTDSQYTQITFFLTEWLNTIQEIDQKTTDEIKKQRSQSPNTPKSFLEAVMINDLTELNKQLPSQTNFQFRQVAKLIVEIYNPQATKGDQNLQGILNLYRTLSNLLCTLYKLLGSDQQYTFLLNLVDPQTPGDKKLKAIFNDKLIGPLLREIMFSEPRTIPGKHPISTKLIFIQNNLISCLTQRSLPLYAFNTVNDLTTVSSRYKSVQIHSTPQISLIQNLPVNITHIIFTNYRIITPYILTALPRHLTSLTINFTRDSLPTMYIRGNPTTNLMSFISALPHIPTSVNHLHIDQSFPAVIVRHLPTRLKNISINFDNLGFGDLNFELISQCQSSGKTVKLTRKNKYSIPLVVSRTTNQFLSFQQDQGTQTETLGGESSLHMTNTAN